MRHATTRLVIVLRRQTVAGRLIGTMLPCLHGLILLVLRLFSRTWPPMTRVHVCNQPQKRHYENRRSLAIFSMSLWHSLAGSLLYCSIFCCYHVYRLFTARSRKSCRAGRSLSYGLIALKRYWTALPCRGSGKKHFGLGLIILTQVPRRHLVSGVCDISGPL